MSLVYRRTSFVLVGFVILIFCICYVYLSGINEFIQNEYQNLSESEKALTNEIKQTIIWVERSDKDAGILPNSVKTYVAKVVGMRYYNSEQKKISSWPIKFWLVRLAMLVSLSDDKILSLYGYYLPYEEGRGLSNASSYYYGLELRELNVEKVIALLTIGRAPHLNSPTYNRDKYERAKILLLSRYEMNKSLSIGWQQKIDRDHP